MISKFMTSQAGKQIITIHILPSVSSSKCNKKIKFCQVLEYNMRNIFLRNSYPKCGGEAIPRLSYKKPNWSDLWINILKCCKVCFYCMFKLKRVGLWVNSALVVHQIVCFKKKVKVFFLKGLLSVRNTGVKLFSLFTF